MTTQSLSSVASHIVGQYSQASKHLVGAYRSGAQRLVTGANTGYVSLLKSGALPLVRDGVRDRLFKVQTRITALVEQGINNGSDRAAQAIDFIAGGLSVGIQRVAAVSDRVEEKLNTQAISKAGRVTILPAARISLMLATRTAEDTKRLSDRVSDAPSEVAPVAPEARRAVKKVVRKVKPRA